MAFTRLTEDQLELLTTAQRERYQQELSLYEQREAFVRRTEEYEKIELPQFKPTLHPIQMAAPVASVRFELPDNPVTLPKTVVLSEEKTLPQMPDCSAAGTELPVVSVPLKEATKFEYAYTQPEVPRVTVPADQEYKYTFSIAGSVSVPQIAANAPADPKAFVAQVSGISVPQVSAAAVAESKPFTAPASEISVPEIAAIEPVRPRHFSVEVSERAVPKVAVVKAPVMAATAAQEIQSISVKAVPPVEIPAPRATLPRMPELTQVQIPTVKLADDSTKKGFTMPEISAQELPQAQLPRQKEERSVVMPTVEKIAVPEVPQNPNVPKWERPEELTISELPRLRDISAPAIPVISSDIITHRTNIPTVQIPDAVRRTARETVGKPPEIPDVVLPAPTIPAPRSRTACMPAALQVLVPQVAVTAPDTDPKQVAEFLEQFCRKD